MSASPNSRLTLESLKKQAKSLLAAIQRGDATAIARIEAVSRDTGRATLRDVQFALAREHGFAGWSELKDALTPDAAAGKRAMAFYQAAADALLEAYRTGDPEAMERHYSYTWHRRAWQGMRTYVQLDLGKRPTEPGGDVELTIDDARQHVAQEYGFDNWDALERFVASVPKGVMLSAKPMGIASRSDDGDETPIMISREWPAVLHALKQHPDARLHTRGQLTDAMLADLVHLSELRTLDLNGCKAITDDGIARLAAMPQLTSLDLSGTGVTDRGLSVLQHLPNLESISLTMTRVTDDGMRDLAHCEQLRRVNLMWTRTGDGAIRALAGKEHLTEFTSGNGVTDAGIPQLHEIPVFKTWRGGEIQFAMTSVDAKPNQLLLRGPFTDRGMQHLRGLDGLFSLNLDAGELGITAAAMEPLISLPTLGALWVDATDDWMPSIARIPRLRSLGIQDTTAGDEGFSALAKSQSIEQIWGRRCHNLGTRGFIALSTMPALRNLSVSCLNVADEGVAYLPQFPALRELMPMDIPDAGYRHIGKCVDLEALTLMYCRDTTDAATEHITGLNKLKRYFNSYTVITDRTPALLSTMDSLEEVTLDQCHELTDAGVMLLARLPRLRKVTAAGARLTKRLVSAFGPQVRVRWSN